MKEGDTMLDGNDSFAAGAAVAAPRMRTWEIILDVHDSPVGGVIRVYGTGLMVSAETRADARMQAQARLCQMRPMDVYVRDLEAAMPSHMIYADHMIGAADLEAFTTSRLDAVNQREWNLLVMDCEAPGTFRSTGIKVISWGRAHAFMAANRLLPRMHTDMLAVSHIEDELVGSPAEPWSPEQVMRILEVFGALAPRAEQAPAAEKGAAAGETPRRGFDFRPTNADPFATARHYNLRLHPLRDCNLEPWTTPEWEIAAQDVNGQGITFMRGTGIKVPGPSREEALCQAQALLPRLRQDLLDVRHPEVGKAGMPAPWSTTQVALLFDEYGPTSSKEGS